MREVRKRDSASWERTRGEEKEVRRGRRGKTPTPDYSKEEEKEAGRRNTKETSGRSWWRKLLQLLGRKPKS